jgi:flavorubredoxin
MLGKFEITALFDGTVTLPLDKLLTNTTPAQLKKLLGRAELTSRAEISINAYLVHTGERIVLIDTGAGSLFPNGGRILCRACPQRGIRLKISPTL